MRRITDEKAEEIAQNAMASGVQKTSPIRRERAKNFFAALLISSGILVMFFAFFPKVDTKTIPYHPSPAFTYVQNLQEKSDDSEIGMDELADHSALFLPTERNFRKRPVLLPTPKGWEFQENRYTQFAQALRDEKFINISKIENIESGKNALIRSSMRNAFTSIGRKQSQKIAQNKTPPCENIKVVNLQTGKTILELYAKNTADLNKQLIFYYEIYPDGTSPMPLTKLSSGSEKIDSQIKKDFLASEQIKKLPIGLYRVTVIP